MCPCPQARYSSFGAEEQYGQGILSQLHLKLRISSLFCHYSSERPLLSESPPRTRDCFARLSEFLSYNKRVQIQKPKSHRNCQLRNVESLFKFYCFAFSFQSVHRFSEEESRGRIQCEPEEERLQIYDSILQVVNATEEIFN